MATKKPSKEQQKGFLTVNRFLPLSKVPLGSFEIISVVIDEELQMTHVFTNAENDYFLFRIPSSEVISHDEPAYLTTKVVDGEMRYVLSPVLDATDELFSAPVTTISRKTTSARKSRAYVLCNFDKTEYIVTGDIFRLIHLVELDADKDIWLILENASGFFFKTFPGESVTERLLNLQQLDKVCFRKRSDSPYLVLAT